MSHQTVPSPHKALHLFNCPQIRTNLTTKHLWLRPTEVATLPALGENMPDTLKQRPNNNMADKKNILNI